MRLGWIGLFGAAMCASSPAWAVTIGDGCGEGSSPGCVPTKPTLPLASYLNGYLAFHNGVSGFDNALALDTEISGSPYFAYYDAQGMLRTPQPFTGQLNLGDAASGLKVAVVKPGGSGEPSISIAATHDGVKTGAASTGGGVAISYLLKLHVDDASLTALHALIAADPTLATAHGSYTMKVGGDASQASAVAFTGFESGQAFQQIIAYCYDYPAGATGCGTHDYALPVGFVAGDTFAGGAANDFYAQIGIAASAYTLNGDKGSASSFIDPTITFSSGFLSLLDSLPDGSISYSLAGSPLPIGSVPEPSSWAMLTIGFGLVGGALRRRRRVAIA